ETCQQEQRAIRGSHRLKVRTQGGAPADPEGRLGNVPEKSFTFNASAHADSLMGDEVRNSILSHGLGAEKTLAFTQHFGRDHQHNRDKHKP
ncbi:MAG: hypothetical protein AAGB34_06215, partial [Planctomycetota bacterium]